MDPDGSVASYSWDFGDGSTESGETAIHEYTTPGSYEITLTVTDDSDLSNVASHWTTAYNRLPQNTGTSLIGAAGNFDPGFADYTSDVLTIRSPAATSTDDHDIFRFVYETMTGDGSITARVADIQSTSEGATVGVTVRSHLTPAATMAAVVVTGDGQIRLENRTLSGLDKIVVAQETASVPVFIRLTRQGYTLRAFTSMDGSIWTSLGTLDIGMPETVFMGVTAQAENGLAFNSTLDYLLLETANSDLPDGFALSDAYPNPFNPSSQITLVVNEDQEISVEMYNVAGQLVQTLFKGEISANQVNEFRFVSTDNLSSGIYFFRVVGDSFAATRKVMLLK